MMNFEDMALQLFTTMLCTRLRGQNILINLKIKRKFAPSGEQLLNVCNKYIDVWQKCTLIRLYAPLKLRHL